MTSIAPYGLSGRNRNYRSEDLTLWCAGGVCVLNGGGPDHSEMAAAQDNSAIRPATRVGVHAATATVAAVLARRGGESGQHVEVSVQESIASQLEMTFEYWPYSKMIASRHGQKPVQPAEMMRCRDGYIYLCCIFEHHWRAFVEIMGNPAWADEEIFSDGPKRAQNWTHSKFFSRNGQPADGARPFTARHRQSGCVCLRSRPMGDLLNSEHLQARIFLSRLLSRSRALTSIRARRSSFRKRRGRFGFRRPRWGNTNAEVFGGWLGMTSARIEELTQKGVI